MICLLLPTCGLNKNQNTGQNANEKLEVDNSTSLKDESSETSVIEEINIQIEDDLANTKSYEMKSKITNYEVDSNFVQIEIKDKKDAFCFMGDVYLSRRPKTAYDDKGIEAIIDEGYCKILSQSDFNIAK